MKLARMIERLLNVVTNFDGLPKRKCYSSEDLNLMQKKKSEN
jgi:hypothetical protein